MLTRFLLLSDMQIRSTNVKLQQQEREWNNESEKAFGGFVHVEMQEQCSTRFTASNVYLFSGHRFVGSTRITVNTKQSLNFKSFIQLNV